MADLHGPFQEHGSSVQVKSVGDDASALASKQTHGDVVSCDCDYRHVGQAHGGGELVLADGGDRQGVLVPHQPSEAKPLGLRTLEKLQARVEDDARQHVVRQELMEKRRTNIMTMVATMRQEFRGQFLSQVPLLSDKVLSKQDQLRVVGKLKPFTLRAGETIISEGEVGDKLYILESGKCEVFKRWHGEDLVIGALAKGAFFGEIGVLYDMPRNATVITTSDVTALSLSRSDLMEVLNDSAIENMRVTARTQLFAMIPLLTSLSSDIKVCIAEAVQKQTWRRGAILAGADYITRRLYMVEEGTLRLELKEDGKDKVEVIQAGGFFGMQGLLFNTPTGATVIVASDSARTLSISYDELVECVPQDRLQTVLYVMKKALCAHMMRNIPELAQMSEEYFEVIQEKAVEVQFESWSVIYAKDEPIDSVYVLEQGTVVEHDGESSALCELPGEKDGMPDERTTSPHRLAPGSYFGVKNLADRDSKAMRTLVALTDATLLRIPQSEIWNAFDEGWRLISRVPFLKNEVLSQAEQCILRGKLQSWNFYAGFKIIREGQPGKFLYVLERGACDAVTEAEKVIRPLKKGDYFGEDSILCNTPYTATVRAVTNVVVFSLSREDLHAIVPHDKIGSMKEVLLQHKLSGSDVSSTDLARASIG